jgi:hypothetical protein
MTQKPADYWRTEFPILLKYEACSELHSYSFVCVTTEDFSLMLHTVTLSVVMVGFYSNVNENEYIVPKVINPFMEFLLRITCFVQVTFRFQFQIQPVHWLCGLEVGVSSQHLACVFQHSYYKYTTRTAVFTLKAYNFTASVHCSIFHSYRIHSLVSTFQWIDKWAKWGEKRLRIYFLEWFGFGILWMTIHLNGANDKQSQGPE